MATPMVIKSFDGKIACGIFALILVIEGILRYIVSPLCLY